MAQVLVAAVGATVGFMVGGPTGAQVGWAAGSMIGGSLFAETQKYEGPRLGDLSVIGSNYGATIPYILGTTRVAGQVVWSSGKREIASTQSAGGKGGPRQEFTTYTYQTDILLLLSDNVISGIRRIWFNGALIYNLGEDASIVSIENSISSTYWARATVYNGSPTQLPDPTYEAAVGAANACAYRGRGSIFIQGLNLGSTGAMPNLTFEVVGDANTIQYGWLRDTRESMTFTYAPAYDTQFLPTGGPFGDPCFYVNTLVADGAYKADTSISNMQQFNWGGSDFTIEGWVSADSLDAVPLFIRYDIALQPNFPDMQSITISKDYNGTTTTIYRCDIYYKNTTTGVNNRIEIFLTLPTVVGGWSHWVLQRKDNELVFMVDGSTAGVYIDYSVSGFSQPGTVLQLNPGVINFNFGPNGPKRFEVGPNTLGTKVGSIRISTIARYPERDDYEKPTSPFPLDQDTLIRLPYKNYDRLPKGYIPVNVAVNELCSLANIPLSQVDTTALTSITEPVYGMAITQVSTIRSVLDSLSNTHFFESYLSDKLYFVPKNRSPVVTIPNSDIGISISSPEDSEIAILKNSDLELPNQIALTYYNISNDYEQDTQYSFRLTNSTQDNTSSLQVPEVFTPTFAKQIVDTQMLNKASSSITTEIKLGSEYLYLVPTDIINVIDNYGTQFTLKILKLREEETFIVIQAELYNNSTFIQTGITSTGYNSQTDIPESPVAILKVLDIPLLQDSLYNNPGLTIFTTNKYNYSNNSISVYKSNDSTNYFSLTNVYSSGTIGIVHNVLGTGNYSKEFDEFSYLEVTLLSGELQSVTRDNLLISKQTNRILLGSEILQYRDAVLINTNKYRLSGFLRGQNGTEWAQSIHSSTDTLIGINDTNGLSYDILQTSDLNKSKYYKALATGQQSLSVIPVSKVFNGISSKPLSPFSARVNRDSSDTVITWYRRTRLSSNLVGSNVISAPLGETTESYEIEVYSNSSFTLVKRTLTSVTNSVTYTSAQQITDFGTNQSVLYLKIYQMSSIVGRGYPLTVTL